MLLPHLSPHSSTVASLSAATLVLRRPPHRKLEAHTPTREPPVNLRVSIQPMVHASPLLLIQYHLHDLAPILLRACPLSDNLNGVHQVREDSVVDCGESTAARALLSLRSAAAVGAFGAGQDTAGGEEDDLPVGEFLFEFTGKTKRMN